MAAWHRSPNGQAHLAKITADRQEKRRTVVEAHGARCDMCGWVPTRVIEYKALEFHHRNPAEKLFTIGGVGLQKSLEALIAEAEKCDLLCARCHRITEAEIDATKTAC